MRFRLWNLLLVAVLVCTIMTGCRAGSVGQMVESAGNAMEKEVEAAGDSLKQSMGTTTASDPTWTANSSLSPQEAQKIALKHAGLASDQVAELHTQYEIEHGIPIYDVEFHHREWEYDYEIQADTGEILAFSKDE